MSCGAGRGGDPQVGGASLGVFESELELPECSLCLWVFWTQPESGFAGRRKVCCLWYLLLLRVLLKEQSVWGGNSMLLPTWEA